MVTQIIFLGVFVAIMAFLWYVGFFEKVRVFEGRHGGYTVAGLDHVGAYRELGRVFSKVDGILREMGIICTKGFGIYYDNPKETPQNELRSFVGDIIDNDPQVDIEKIRASILRVDHIPNRDAVVVELPIRSKLSYMINPVKAYPRMNKYMNAHDFDLLQAYEIYDVPLKLAYYVMHFTKNSPSN
jgi:hypothetical protein